MKRVSSTIQALHAAFQTLLPRIEQHAVIYFRDIRCPSTRQEYVAETVSLAWKWFRRLVERGKDPCQFPSALASYAARAARSGRRVCGLEKAKDAMSPVAQQKHGFAVERLPSATCLAHEALYRADGQIWLDEFEQRLQDNRVTPVPEQAAFRIDFPAWLRCLTARERRLIRQMLLNHRTKDLARWFELSPSRISQLRRDFKNDWQRYIGDEAETP